jgi:hypothetical protein
MVSSIEIDPRGARRGGFAIEAKEPG